MKTQIFLTSYFNTVQNTQDGFVKNNSYEYIKPWYESIMNLGLEGVIFHDNLSDHFVDKYINEHVSFVKVKRLGYTNNDERFFHYHRFIRNNKYEKVHITDCCDVTINKDPYSFITGRKIYTCLDTMLFKDYSVSGVPVRQLINLEDDLELLNYPLLNMGVISGKRDTMLRFVSILCFYRVVMERKSDNLNMPLGNYIIRKYINNVFTGFPYCTPYKENNINKEFYFKHK